MGVRPDAPTIETIVLVTFYEMISVLFYYIIFFPVISTQPTVKWCLTSRKMIISQRVQK